MPFILVLYNQMIILYSRYKIIDICTSDLLTYYNYFDNSPILCGTYNDTVFIISISLLIDICELNRYFIISIHVKYILFIYCTVQCIHVHV